MRCRRASRTGRGGLGTVVVFSAGNARTEGQDVNYHGFQNHRGITSVAATDSAGNVTYFSTPGAALLVSAPGSGITTTDRVGAPGYSGGDYATMAGTSFSSPLVSGIAALMLDANPGLGWRDVQEILASTAVRTGSNPSVWAYNGADNWNGGAMHVSHDYGFGLVDAYAAVRVAESWRDVSTSSNELAADGVLYPNAAIPDVGSVSSTITLAQGLRIDHVEVDVALLHANISQLQLTLTSPDGTQSLLFHNPATSGPNIYFTFSTTRDWGELSGGTWTLTVTDTQSGASGTLSAWALRAYGDLAGDDTYVYTDEFSALAVADPSRLLLSDGGGTDSLNTAAIASNTVLDLRPGHSASIGGQSVAISATTIIENADTGDGNDTLIGNDAANALCAWRGNDVLNGGLGADTLDGGAGADTMSGGLGDDTYFLDNAGDVITELANQGTDTVVSSVSKTLGTNLENLTLAGTSSINGYGNGTNNILIGNIAANVLAGYAGADTMSGGAGDDTYYVENVGDVVTESAASGKDTVNSSINYTLTADVEWLVLTGAAITGSGNNLNNFLVGNGGNNILDGGVGADTMNGGLGNDTFIVDNAGDYITELAGQGIDTVMSSVTRYLGNYQENLTLTGVGTINGYGNSDNNVLTGNSAANVLSGNAGADTMSGGAGDDTYYVENVGDVVTESAASGKDTVNSSISYTLTADVEWLVLTGAAITGTGNNLNNFLVGNGGNNTLDGGAGADTMNGGLGDDTFIVDNAGDYITELAGQGIDTVMSSVTRYLGSNQENLTLTGANAINGYGFNDDNLLRGNSAANVLSGGGGADTLAGGLGNDSLSGGNGADKFLFDTAPGAGNVDTLSDFLSGTDIVQLAQANFGGLAFGAVAAGAFIAGAGFTTAADADDRLIYNTSNGALFYDADGFGVVDAAVQLAVLTAHPGLLYTDFFVT
ncbi:MAG: S8 family serine peptidase [Candidatus Accumulibacter propinquus]